MEFERLGFGLGLMINVAMVNFNLYFKKRRTFMMSLTKTFIGICNMVYPILLSILMETFGFRGSVAIIAAINAHTIIAMIAMHPVEWHYKSIEVPIYESESCKFMNDFLCNFFSQMDSVTSFCHFFAVMKTDGNLTSMNDTSEENKEGRSYLSVQAENSNESLTKNTTDEIVLKNERSKSLDPTSINMNFEEIMPLKSSRLSLGDWNDNTASIKNHEHSNNHGIW